MVAAGFAGRGKRIRSQIGNVLGLLPGQRVLDVGCGTGTLALALAKRVRRVGTIDGADAAAEMMAVARAKATRRKIPVRFQIAAAQALPFSDSYFDAVVTSLVLHHLPNHDQLAAVREILRVLSPGGALVIAEFRAPTHAISRKIAQHLLGHAMATNNLADIMALAADAGFIDLERHDTSVGWAWPGGRPQPGGSNNRVADA